MADEIGVKEGQFNQAIALQQRHDILFRELNARQIHLFKYDNEVNAWNYDLCFNLTNTIFASVASFFTEDEKRELELLRKETRLTLRIKHPYKTIHEDGLGGARNTTLNDYESQDAIADKLLEFRMRIELFMDKHGLGNPTKQDVTKSVVRL